MGDAPDGARHVGVFRHGYFQLRLVRSPRRRAVWTHVCRYLERWIAADAEVLELGAGWCDFSNLVRARRVVAMDLDATVLAAAAPHVEARVGDCTDLSVFPDETFDVVMASNLLEHLDRTTATAMLSEAARVLRPGGRLILLQPNFRLRPRSYFDDFTHVTVYTDRSLPDFLASEGWSVEEVRRRFLPMTLRSRASALTFLVPLYLRSPLKPFAGQMLVTALRPRTLITP